MPKDVSQYVSDVVDGMDAECDTSFGDPLARVNAFLHGLFDYCDATAVDLESEVDQVRRERAASMDPWEK